MEEKLISLETAKLAKEKGINIQSRDFYMGEKLIHCENIHFPLLEHEYYAPTQSLLQQYLWEKHNIFITIGIDQTTTPKFDFTIVRCNGYADFTNSSSLSLYLTTEEALTDAFNIALTEL